MTTQRLVFTGHVASFGTAAGIRFVVGVWARSPFGAFADVMVQTLADDRVLLAPTRQIADFLASTYSFDRSEVGAVTATLSGDRLTVTAPGLAAEVAVGRSAPLDALLRLVPGRMASSPWWLRAIDPVVSRVIPGVHTAGRAGHGRREYFGVRRARRIEAVAGSFAGRDLGGLAALRPPVDFGFSSAPPNPQILAVTTTVDLP